MEASHIRWLASGAVAGLLLFPSFIRGQRSASKRTPPATQSTQWITHKDPQLYSVETPPGWTVTPDKQKGWLRLKGTQDEEVVIWPVFIPGTVDPRFAPFIHATLAASSPYQAQWEGQHLAAPNVLRAYGRSANAVALSVFTWISSPHGLAGFYYLVAAREPVYREEQTGFARILGSFRIIGATTAQTPAAAATTPAAPGAVSPGGIRYVKFTDPKEGAYSIEVPAGWKTEGGMFRFHAIDIRGTTETVSPDGQMRIVVGDARYGPLIEPTPYFPEGSVYAPYGLKHEVRHFASGTALCQEYVLSKFSPVCPNLQIDEAKDRPDQVPNSEKNSPIVVYATWGDVSFHCGEPAQPKTGHCQAGTEKHQPAGAGAIALRPWRVYFLGAYLAPRDKESLAESIYRHMLGHSEMNPQWEAMQAQLSASAARSVSQSANEISDAWMASQQRRNAIEDEMARRRSNATLNVVDVTDPQTGWRAAVESGSNYYWVDPRGRIVGTDTDSCPNVDFRSLLQLR